MALEEMGAGDNAVFIPCEAMFVDVEGLIDSS